MAYSPPTHDQVLYLYKRPVDTDLVQQAIEAATSMMTSLSLTNDTVGLWLSAHFTAAANNDPLKEKALGVEAEYAFMDKGLGSTRYGQQVLILDTTGELAKVTKGKKFATFQAL